MQNHSDNRAPEHIVINEGADERDIPTREAFVAPEPRPERMTGPERGAYEDARQSFVVTVPTWGRRAA